MQHEDFPFKSLIEENVTSAARLKFKSQQDGQQQRMEGNMLVEEYNGTYYLRVPGIAINDNFQLLNNAGAVNTRIYMMAVPYIGGFNPDYSGLDFCEAASAKIMKAINVLYGKIA